MSKSAKRRLGKLWGTSGPITQIEEIRRQNDIKCRRGVAKLERIRVAADVEDVSVNQYWTAVATVKVERYADMEKKHRDWIFRRL